MMMFQIVSFLRFVRPAALIFKSETNGIVIAVSLCERMFRREAESHEQTFFAGSIDITRINNCRAVGSGPYFRRNKIHPTVANACGVSFVIED